MPPEPTGNLFTLFDHPADESEGERDSAESDTSLPSDGSPSALSRRHRRGHQRNTSIGDAAAPVEVHPRQLWGRARSPAQVRPPRWEARRRAWAAGAACVWLASPAAQPLHTQCMLRLPHGCV
jgi:hypothetical protein